MSDIDPGEAFRKAMRNRDVSPTQLARDLSVSPNVVSNWRQRGVSKNRAAEVGEYLGVLPHLIAAQIDERAARKRKQEQYAEYLRTRGHVPPPYNSADSVAEDRPMFLRRQVSDRPGVPASPRLSDERLELLDLLQEGPPPKEYTREKLAEMLLDVLRDLAMMRQQLDVLVMQRQEEDGLLEDWRVRRIAKLLVDPRMSPRDMDLIEELIHAIVR